MTALCETLRRPRLLVSGSAGLSFGSTSASRRSPGGAYTSATAHRDPDQLRRPGLTCPDAGVRWSAAPGVELKLVDEQRERDRRARRHTIGEVVVRSAAVFAGYLNREDATAAVLDGDGWFHTGDLATRTEEGAIRILVAGAPT